MPYIEVPLNEHTNEAHGQWNLFYYNNNPFVTQNSPKNSDSRDNFNQSMQNMCKQMTWKNIPLSM